MPSSHGEDWQPLLTYRNSLLHGDTDQQTGPAVSNKRVYTRKKKNQEVEDEDVGDSDDNA